MDGGDVARPRLEIAEVEAAYGDLRALGGVTLSVGAGEIVALLGPNGAGKTTSLKLFIGLIDPDAGSVEVVAGRSSPGVRPTEQARCLSSPPLAERSRE